MQALEQAIVQRIGEPRYKLWFEGRTCFHWDDDQLTVGVPNRHFGEWVEKNFGAATAAAAKEVFGQAMQVRFVIDPQLFQAARREQDEARQTQSDDRKGAENTTSQSRDRKGAENTTSQSRDRKGAENTKEICDHEATEAKPLPHGRGSPAPRRVRRWRRLGDFVVGPCNRVAYAAGKASLRSRVRGPIRLFCTGRSEPEKHTY